MHTERHQRSWRRRAVIGSIIVATVWLVIAGWLLGTAWYRVPHLAPQLTPNDMQAILTPDAYDEVIATHRRPYVYAIGGSAGGRVVIFGSEHTRQPDDPQIKAIQNAWRELDPTVALVESDLGMMFPAFMDPVHTFGEAGVVHELARDAGVATYTWEPLDHVVIQSALKQGFAPEQVALRWVLGPYFSNLRHGRPPDPEAFVSDTLHERGSIEGIDGLLPTTRDVDAAWSNHFPNGPDWRDVSDQYGLPGFLGEIDLNRPRDEHLVACVAELVSTEERVFVICGSSHAVKIEPALRSLFKQSANEAPTTSTSTGP